MDDCHYFIESKRFIIKCVDGACLGNMINPYLPGAVCKNVPFSETPDILVSCSWLSNKVLQTTVLVRGQ
jgi:hypothetical protein